MPRETREKISAKQIANFKQRIAVESDFLEQKPCSKCRKVKPLTEFYTRRNKLRSGVIAVRPESSCKQCFRERAKRYRQRLKQEGRYEEVQERQDQWAREHRERVYRLKREREATKRREEGIPPRKGKSIPHGKRLPAAPLAAFLKRQIESLGRYPEAISSRDVRRLYAILHGEQERLQEEVIDRLLFAFDCQEMMQELYPVEESLVGYHYVSA